MNSFTPDVFVIGAMKAGTSTLFRNILVHPAICRTNNKEVNYFLYDHPPDQLQALYSRQFNNPERIKCDVSPRYAQCHNYPGVAVRMHRANPQAKIIYIVRDPVDRIISHLHHNLLRDRYAAHNMDAEVRNNNDYVLCSRYDFQLNEYLKVFPPGQVHVLVLEELKKNPRMFCDRLQAFLGIALPDYQDKKFNVSEGRYKIKYYDWVHEHIKLKPLVRFYHYFWMALNLRPERPLLTTETKTFLKRELEADVRAFASRFTLDINLWPNFA